MKIVCILFLIIGACWAVPVDQAKSSSSSTDESVKTKRGLYVGADYHAPLLTHSAYLGAPSAAAVVHHAPAFSVAHGPALALAHTPAVAVAHAPAVAVAHAPVYTSHSLYSAPLHTFYHH